MNRHGLSVNETVDRILSGVEIQHPDKPASPSAKSAAVHNHPMKKIAEALRDLPEKEMSYDVLHVVKIAMMHGQLGALPPPELTPEEGSREVVGLRKLANQLRMEDHEDHERLLAKGADTLTATRGLMLLRELVRE